MNDEEIWSYLEDILGSSTCAKTHTAAAIVKNGEIISVGYNICRPERYQYGEKISSCARANITTGDRYELCSPVHAEVMACLNIRPLRDLSTIGRYAGHIDLSVEEIMSAFTEKELSRLNGASLYLRGHYWVCKRCETFAKTAGVAMIKLNKGSAEEIKSQYMAQAITRDEQ